MPEGLLQGIFGPLLCIITAFMFLHFLRAILFLLISFCTDVVGITVMVALLFSKKIHSMPPAARSHFGLFWGSFWAMFLLKAGQSFLMKFCKPFLGVNYSDGQYTKRTLLQIILLCWGPFWWYIGAHFGLCFSISGELINFSHEFFYTSSW